MSIACSVAVVLICVGSGDFETHIELAKSSVFPGEPLELFVHIHNLQSEPRQYPPVSKEDFRFQMVKSDGIEVKGERPWNASAADMTWPSQSSSVFCLAAGGEVIIPLYVNEWFDDAFSPGTYTLECKIQPRRNRFAPPDLGPWRVSLTVVPDDATEHAHILECLYTKSSEREIGRHWDIERAAYLLASARSPLAAPYQARLLMAWKGNLKWIIIDSLCYTATKEAAEGLVAFSKYMEGQPRDGYTYQIAVRAVHAVRAKNGPGVAEVTDDFVRTHPCLDEPMKPLDF